MSKSLQDQLRALGLGNSPPGKRERKSGGHAAAPSKGEPPVERGARQRGSDAAGHSRKVSELSLEKAYRLREQQAKEQAKQARERKRLEDRRRRQLNNAIRAIVEPNRLNDPAAEFSRNFMFKGRIRKVSVTAEQLAALNKGELGLVYLVGGYHILLPEHVEQVRSLSAEHGPDLTGNAGEDDEYPVPDDLIW